MAQKLTIHQAGINFRYVIMLLRLQNRIIYGPMASLRLLPESILDWMDKIVENMPLKVQTYTLDHWHSVPKIKYIDKTQLNHIRQRLTAKHIAVAVY